MSKKIMTPDYLFESSWEVCNKVGGIYTVLSTKAQTLQKLFNDKVIFIGPDVWGDAPIADFIEDKSLFAEWQQHADEENHLRLKVGRWDVPGKPPVVLVDFKPLTVDRDSLFFHIWQNYQVDSMHAYGDYDESCIFAYAVGKVIESFYGFYKLDDKKVVALFNEWMLGMGSLYIKNRIPAIATIFTTHATSIGRSIAGNNKALYAYLDNYNGDQMARELNMEAKHSLEKQAAHYADCFTTVSEITARECTRLLDKTPDIVTPNGFERNFVPSGNAYTAKRKEARQTLIRVAEKLLGCPIDPEALLVSTSGRYEYRNKGIDVFIEAMNRVRTSGRLQKEVVAFITVPAWTRAARADLQEALEKDIKITAPMQMPFSTHWLHQMEEDKVINYLLHAGFTNAASEKLKIIFVPCYLDGKDGIFNKTYYDILIGMDATVYPSYYEPWGYTPLESIAFGIPTITTNLAGFGMWALEHLSGERIEDGVAVVERTDFNYFDVADAISNHILTLTNKNKKEINAIRQECQALAGKAEWREFIAYYQQAFAIACGDKQ
ncbi:glycosyltransferase [Parabacteroides sp. PF5-6]|uniref:glycosyltransferase n=1 Tax=Parabacteroides sp. PF5-6 TaxID=1742403 RepID=UPI0024051756|nr:glycosyltransferase [Parabacteroides sp. PF5-6]MDF9830143.1 glycosyltransferase involved in cell wall biosynthesis [Parabacteroides sp. PF5-6]